MIKSFFSIHKINTSLYGLLILTLIALLIAICSALQLSNLYQELSPRFIPLTQDFKQIQKKTASKKSDFNSMLIEKQISRDNQLPLNGKVIELLPSEHVLRDQNKTQIYALILWLIVAVVLLFCFLIRLVIIHKRVGKRINGMSSVMSLLSNGETNLTISQKANDEVGSMEQRLIRLQSYIEHLQLQANTDPLTNLKNRRAFDETLHKELKRAKRNHHPVSLLLIDIDHFKQFNDYYGHPEGDVIIKEVAGLIIKACPRENDFTARIGGDEFVIILPNTDKVGAELIASRLLSSTRKLKRENKASLGMGYLTLSIGSKSFDSRYACSTKELYNFADKALYKAKVKRNHAVLD